MQVSFGFPVSVHPRKGTNEEAPADFLGLGLIMVPSVPVIAHWFDRRLSLAQGVGAAGSGLGGLIMANAVRAALERWGVKWALIMSGLYSAILIGPAIFFFKGRHKAVGARSAPYQLKWLVHRGYIWVLLWAFFASELTCTGSAKVAASTPSSRPSDCLLHRRLLDGSNGH